MVIMIRTYNELLNLNSFDERYEYLKLNGQVSGITFGFDRYLNQMFYKSPIWLKVRNEIIIRDLGCDLGLDGYEIHSKIIIHHMNPISVDDILQNTNYLADPNYLICTSLNTHNAIHYGNRSPNIIKERHSGDTCPWRI